MKSIFRTLAAAVLCAASAVPAAAAPYVFTTINATGYYVLAGDPAQGQPPQSYVGFTVNADGSNFQSFAHAGYEQTGVSGINDAGIVGVRRSKASRSSARACPTYLALFVRCTLPLSTSSQVSSG